MESHERMLAALELKQPDRVPVWELAFNEESIINIARNFTSDVPELKQVSDMTIEEKIQLFNALCILVEELDLDGITLVPLGQREKVAEDLIRDELGVVSRVSLGRSSVSSLAQATGMTGRASSTSNTTRTFLRAPPCGTSPSPYTSTELPIWIASSGCSGIGLVTASPLSWVPFVLSRSKRSTSSPFTSMRAWVPETLSSSSAMG